MPLLESGDYINTENYSNKYFKGPFSFFQLIETAPVVINRIQVLFNYYYEEWNKEIKYQSSTDVITNNSFFKSIIDLGSEVIPYIIEVLRDTPSFLIIALYKITGENPVKPDHCGKIKEMTKDWIEWWDKRYSAIG
ncbi:MAG: hypothetical protein LBC51_00655 [Treponema sp.]|nr:hypothetical protein [Treponema sp.]